MNFFLSSLAFIYSPYHVERQFLSARVPITQLTDDEKKNHLFRIPPQEGGSKKTKPEKPKVGI